MSSSPAPPLSSSALPPYDHSMCSLQLHKSCACVNFIAEHTKAKEEATKVGMTHKSPEIRFKIFVAK